MPTLDSSGSNSHLQSQPLSLVIAFPGRDHSLAQMALHRCWLATAQPSTDCSSTRIYYGKDCSSTLYVDPSFTFVIVAVGRRNGGIVGGGTRPAVFSWSTWDVCLRSWSIPADLRRSPYCGVISTKLINEGCIDAVRLEILQGLIGSDLVKRVTSPKVHWVIYISLSSAPLFLWETPSVADGPTVVRSGDRVPGSLNRAEVANVLTATASNAANWWLSKAFENFGQKALQIRIMVLLACHDTTQSLTVATSRGSIRSQIHRE
ncbi:hypothetical protein V8B97DRAFT_1920451 [Scleroderma yunnanense]